LNRLVITAVEAMLLGVAALLPVKPLPEPEPEPEPSG
jgi:hypothetical protein